MHRLLALSLTFFALASCQETPPPEEPDSSTAVDALVADTAPLPVPIGAPCADNDACLGGLCATLLPGGSCTVACDVDACPEGALCREVNGFPFCLETCTQQSECRTAEGYACVHGACDQGCRNVFDCEAGEVCSAEGLCETNVERKNLGLPCATAGDCLSSKCLAGSNGGLCTEVCAVGSCFEGWTCETVAPVGVGGGELLCVPPRTTVDSVILTGEDNAYSFTLSSDVVSFLIVAESSNPLGTAQLQNLRSPTGELFAGSSNNGFTSPLRIFTGNQGHSSAIVPNDDNPALQPIPGTWSFEFVVSTGDAPKQVTVFFTRRDALGLEPDSATFDVNFFIPDGALQEGFTFETAKDNPLINGALQHIERQYWSKQGLSVGEVRYFDLSTEYLRIDDDDELHNMLADETPRAPEGGLNVFLVREFYNTSIQGIAAGIPGAVGKNGNAGAGVTIAVQITIKAFGDNMAHELGHFLGLYHVTEQNGIFHDTIADTPECLQAPSIIPLGDASGCWKNVMFPILLGDIAPQSFSDAQGRVMRLNPRGQR